MDEPDSFDNIIPDPTFDDDDNLPPFAKDDYGQSFSNIQDSP